MNLIKLDMVRRHTRRELTPDQAKTCQSAPKRDPGLARNPNPVERL
jgi:hypothetical protein